MNRRGGSVLFRVDGGPGIGAGHLMRCLGLAQELHDQGTACCLATATADYAAIAHWRNERIPIEEIRSDEDSGSLAAIARTRRADWIVVDGYTFDEEYLARLASAVPAHLLTFFDQAPEPSVCDLAVNQNPGAEIRFPNTSKMLSGVRFASLRREIRTACEKRAAHREKHVVPNILISFGAADDTRLAQKTADVLSRSAVPFTADVVADDTENSFGDDSRFNFTGYTDLFSLMMRADMAICAGGVTSLELAALGIPAIVIRVADNQTGVEALIEAGAAIFAGTGPDASGVAARLCLELAFDPQRTESMSRQAMALVDGMGPKRIAEAMSNIEARA